MTQIRSLSQSHLCVNVLVVVLNDDDLVVGAVSVCDDFGHLSRDRPSPEGALLLRLRPPLLFARYHLQLVTTDENFGV